MRKLIFILFIISNLNALNLKDINTTCPVTLTNSLKSPNLMSVIEYKNGKILLFSSPKAMFSYIYNIDDLEIPLKEIYVSNYNNQKLILAKDAFYVFGSKVLSKSGDDLIAFDSNNSAANFMKEFGGSVILKYNNINKRLIDFMNER